MKIKKITEKLDCKIVYLSQVATQNPINAVIASDLMSDVLTDTRDNALLLTSLCTEQSIRTADIIDAVAVVVVKGKKILPGMKNLAEELDITLLSTNLCKFEASLKIGKLMEKRND